MRIFIGIKIHNNFQFASIKKALPYDGIKWVKEDNLHLTLLFIGQASDKQVLQIHETLKRVVPNFSGLDIGIHSLGQFHKRKKGGILWLGIQKKPSLKQLQKHIQEEIIAILPELSIQHSEYTPHITLARFKTNSSNIKSIENYKIDNIPLQHIPEVILYKSRSTPNGVQYVALEKYDLKNKS